LGKQQFLTKDYSLPEDADYILIDYDDLITYQLQYGNNLYFKNQYQEALKNWTKNLSGYGLVDIKDSIALYQKNADDQFVLVEFPTDQLKLTNPKEIVLDRNIKYLGFSQKVNQYQLFWEVNLPLKNNYEIKLTLTKDNKTSWQKIYPFAYDQLYNQEFLGKKIIQANHWFGFGKNIPSGVYELKLNLMEIESGGIEVNSIRSTKNVIDKENIIGQDLILGNVIL